MPFNDVESLVENPEEVSEETTHVQPISSKLKFYNPTTQTQSSSHVTQQVVTKPQQLSYYNPGVKRTITIQKQVSTVQPAKPAKSTATKVLQPSFEEMQQKFYSNPNINPKTGNKIKIGAKTYNALVEEFGVPPTTNVIISAPSTPTTGKSPSGKNAGLTFEALQQRFFQKPNENPYTERKISIDGPVYKELVKKFGTPEQPNSEVSPVPGTQVHVNIAPASTAIKSYFQKSTAAPTTFKPHSQTTVTTAAPTIFKPHSQTIAPVKTVNTAQTSESTTNTLVTKSTFPKFNPKPITPPSAKTITKAETKISNTNFNIQLIDEATAGNPTTPSGKLTSWVPNFKVTIDKPLDTLENPDEIEELEEIYNEEDAADERAESPAAEAEDELESSSSDEEF
jgi:hypothetical protein